MMTKYLAATAALALTAGSVHAQTLMFRISGKAQNDYLGECVRMAGDFNRDGYTDFITGAKFDDSNGDNAGIARVYSGKDASVLLSVVGGIGDWVGLSVAGAGDANNDDFDDVIIGAPGNDPSGTNSGSAYLYSGKTGSLLRTFNGFAAFDHFGTSVAGVGDVDGDGSDDVSVGAPQEGNGTVRVYSGDSGSLIWTFNGIAAGDALGDAVNGAGDVNHDGFPDIIAGAPLGDLTGSDAGYIRVYSGRTGLVIWTLGGGTDDHFGTSVDGAGDYNDDGFADFIVGSPNDEPNGLLNAGSAFIYSGFDATQYRWYKGAAAGYQLGFAVAGAGNSGGGGYPTVIIGAPSQAGGTVYLYNRFGLVYSFAGVAAYASSVDGGGDANKDGRDDFIVGDPERNVFGPNTGRAYLYLSSTHWASNDVYGGGWPGTQGVPDLTVNADPVLCSTITLSLENSRGSTTAGALFIGLSAASIPTALGGTLLLVPHTVIPVTIPSLGLSLPLAILCDSQFAGLAIYMQALESDPGASQDVSFTPGLQLIQGGTSPY